MSCISQESRESARDACLQEIKLPPYFIQSLIIDQIGTEVFNKTAELNLAIATHLSDKIADDAMCLLESSNKELVSYKVGVNDVEEAYCMVKLYTLCL